MTLTLTATVGSASANTFVSVATATAYLAGRSLASAWSDDPDDDALLAQQQALVTASRSLSALRWKGRRVDSVQALAWPRYDVWDVETQWPIATTVIPQWLQDATCELALAVLQGGTSDIFALPSTEGVIEKTVGPLTTRFAEPFAQRTGLRRYPAVWQLIAPYLASNSMQVPLVRG